MTVRPAEGTRVLPWWRVRPPAGGGVWRHPDFVRLWTSQTLSDVGSEVTLLAIPLAAVALGAGPAQMGWLAAARYLPTLLLGLLAGAWVDRLPRRPLLIATDLGRGAVLACVPVAAVTGHLRLEVLYPLAFLANALAVLADVAHESYLPVLVGRGRLLEANSGVAVGRQAAQVAGPSLAGALVQGVTAPLALLADAASFVVSAILVGSIRTTEPTRARTTEPVGLRALWGEIAAGVRFVVADPVLRPLTGAWGLYWFVFFLFWGQHPLYATRELGLSPMVFGLVGSLAAVGGVLGALATKSVTERFGAGRTMAGAVLGGALGTLLIPAAGGPPTVAAAVLVLAQGLVALTEQLYYINYASTFQALAPDRLRGRVGASIRVLTAGTAPVGALLGGFLAEAIGLRATAVVAGLGVVVAFVWVARSPVRSLRTLPSDVTAPEPPQLSADAAVSPAGSVPH